MTTKIKTTLLAGFFFFGLLTGLQAQDKYEYASIAYYANPKKGSPKAVTISVSQAGKFYKIESEVVDGQMSENLTPVIEVVNKMATEGWEVYNNDMMAPAGYVVQIYYYLRKKIN